jgi:hypothetical protein
MMRGTDKSWVRQAEKKEGGGERERERETNKINKKVG